MDKYISNHVKYDRLYEINASDIFGGEFNDFVKKYKKFKKDDSYFVQFSNFKDNIMDKSAVEIPDHSDPIGNYGYPLKYVIDNPADIWYGRGAKYLRVLRNKSRKILRLQWVGITDIENNLRKVKLFKGWSHFEDVKKVFGHKGTKSDQKTFMSYIQRKVENIDSKRSPEPSMRTSKEQTQLFLKMGYHVIIDDARKDTTALINEREPTQAIFLTPTSFNVLEVFNLGAKSNRGLTLLEPDEKQKQALAAKIFNGIGDRLKSSDLNTFRGDLYWSNIGRKIEININTEEGYTDNKKIGQKLHKAYKKNDQYVFSGKLCTEFGIIYLYGDSYDEIIKDAISDFKELQRNPEETDFELESKDSYQKALKDKEDAERDIAYEAGQKAIVAHFKSELLPDLNEYAKLTKNKPISKNIHKNGYYVTLLAMLHSLGVAILRYPDKSFNQFLRDFEENTKIMDEESTNFFLTSEYKNIVKLIKEVYDLSKEVREEDKSSMGNALTNWGGKIQSFYWVLRFTKERLGIE